MQQDVSLFTRIISIHADTFEPYQGVMILKRGIQV